jgi:DNA helicase-2/ATP-dependent DNA helicase PcrA
MVEFDYDGIVENTSSPTLVLAGPGSGKTYMLADRIARLLAKGVAPDTITALAFNRDAAYQLQRKLTTEFGVARDKLPHISTMNAFGFRLLKEAPRKVGLLKQELGVQGSEGIKKLLFRDAALAQDLTVGDAEKAMGCKLSGDCKEDEGRVECQVCRKYHEIMAKCNLVDFDDQVLFACKLLETDNELRNTCLTQTVHLLVDEYQDINAGQHRLIELLSRNTRNHLFVVGDDAQCIYSFRGSSPRFIRDFGSDFPGATCPPLPFSRRCPKTVVDEAGRMLKSFDRAWKGPFELENMVEHDHEPALRQLPSEKAEAEEVARIASKYAPKHSVLVLAPKVDFFAGIAKELRKKDVAYFCPADDLPRVQRVKRLLDWLETPDDDLLVRFVVEDLLGSGANKVAGAAKQKRCTAETLRKRVSVETEVARFWETVSKTESYHSVLSDYAGCSKEVAGVRDGLGELLRSHAFLERRLDADPDQEKELAAEKHGGFLRRLAVLSGAWTLPSELSEDLAQVVELAEGQRHGGPGAVQLMTMRKAKGLEADVVIVVGLEDDLVPNPKRDETEEARLFYVAMTRAKQRLYLLHAFRRPRNISYGEAIMDKPRSRFLNAIGRKSEYRPSYHK